jgi:penicillin amidase
MKRRRWPKVLAWIAAALCLLLIVATGAAVYLTRASWPQTEGSLSAPGLDRQVKVVRDGYGIPQVYAASSDDLFFAQGFVHAQDRFWEMDVRRHVTAGRAAEMLGEPAASTDAFIRTLGWRRVAEQELPLLSAETRAALDAYARGVNAYLKGKSPRELSFEYVVLGLTNSGYEVEPWTPADSVAWLKAMSWDLRGNMQEEIQRSLISAEVGVDRTESLYPDFPFADHEPIVTQGAVVGGAFDQDAEPAAQPTPAPPIAAMPALRRVLQALDAVPPLMGPSGSGIGSNSWVVSGDRTSTGEPLLANDPHLGASLPGIWYQMGIHCAPVTVACPYDVAGYTFSGHPGVVIGHNADIAWGFTNLGPDVSDLYLEKVEGDTYRVGAQDKPLTSRREVIMVAGGDPLEITVRSTEHGPLLSDVADLDEDFARYGQVGVDAPTPEQSPARGDGYAVALRWTALDPGRTADAVLLLNQAEDWADFQAAAKLFESPSQNMVYADTRGSIGYQAPGRIPVRAAGDGRWPAPGWDPAYTWESYIPFEALPSVTDPDDGFIVTANAAVIDTRTYPYFLTDDWSYGARQQRIKDLVGAEPEMTPERMAEIQMDNWNENASFLVPALLKVSVGRDTAEAQALLDGWDFQQDRDSAPAAFFNATWRNLLATVFDDELPEDARADGGDRWFEVVRGLLAEPDDPWWDDRQTPQLEGRDEALANAMRAADDELTERFGGDPAAWRWGAMHTLTLENGTFGQSGIAPIEWIFNRGPIETSGGDSIVNATGWTAYEGYEVDWVPSMRQVIDLSNLDKSRWVQLTGNSGHVYHPNYWDQAELWRDGDTTPWPFSEAAVLLAAEDTLTLTP